METTKAYLERSENNAEKAKQITDTVQALEQKWNSLHFGEVRIGTVDNNYVFEIQLYFNELDPNLIQVELFANGMNTEAPVIQVMQRGRNVEGESNAYQYSASVPATRPASDFTARAIPSIPTVSVPLEISNILWQH